MLKITSIAVLFSVACGGGSRPAGPHVLATVGSAGGTFSLMGGPTVTIPPGAIGSPTVFSIEETADVRPGGAMTPIYRFGPEGTVFGKPVTVSFPVSAEATVYWSQLGNPFLYDAPATTHGSAEVTYFTSGFAGLPCSAAARCAPANACHTGTMQCGSGTPVCGDSGKSLPELESCGNGKVCKAGACAIAQPRTISGAITTVFETDDGSRTTLPGDPLDNEFAVSAILVPSSSGYTTIPVVTRPDFTFSVAGVPEGRYFLQIDQPARVPDEKGTIITVYNRWLVEATSNTPDLSSLIAASADRALPSRATTVAVNLSNLSPIQSSARVQVVSRNPDVYDFITEPNPPAGSTAFSTTKYWNMHLPDASRGDLTWLFQSAGSAGGTPSASRSSIVRYAALALTIPDGGGSISGAMQVAPQAQIRADLKFSQFNALSPAANPAATPDYSALDVRALAHSATFPNRPLNYFGVHLGRIFPDSFTADGDYGSLAYAARFLDATWIENVGLWYTWLAALHDPDDATKTVDTYPAYFAAIPLKDAPASFVPTLSPPAAPMLGGKDAFTPRSGVGSTPAISWSAPAIGKPTSYVVGVGTRTAAPKTGDIVSLSATIYSGTSFVVPDGYLEPGRAYSGWITAVATPGDAIDTPIWGFGGNYASASCTFGLFRP